MTINSFIIMWIAIFSFVFFGLWFGRYASKSLKNWGDSFYGNGSLRHKIWKMKYRK